MASWNITILDGDSHAPDSQIMRLGCQHPTWRKIHPHIGTRFGLDKSEPDLVQNAAVTQIGNTKSRRCTTWLPIVNHQLISRLERIVSPDRNIAAESAGRKKVRCRTPQVDSDLEHQVNDVQNRSPDCETDPDFGSEGRFSPKLGQRFGRYKSEVDSDLGRRVPQGGRSGVEDHTVIECK